MSRYEWARLNLDPLGGISYYERSGRAIKVGTPRAYARTWGVGYGAGRGQPTMLWEPIRQVKTVYGLPVYYAEPFGFYVGDYPGEFDTLAEAEAYARTLAAAKPAAAGSPMPLVALLAMLLMV